jgi:DNA-binding GntR family transcriptional regulator
MYLAHIAGNSLYELVLDTVHENITRYYDRLLPRREEIMEKNYRDLCEIVRAVELGQADRARSIAQDHVRRFNLFME